MLPARSAAWQQSLLNPELLRTASSGSPTAENPPSTHSGEYCRQTDYDSYHTRASIGEGGSDDRTHQCTRTQPASRLLTRRGRLRKSTRHHCWGGPLDAQGNLVGSGDRHAQTQQTLENLALALEAVGARGRDVIKTTVYVVAGERGDLSAVWVGVQQSGIAEAASTLVGVSMLALEGQLVEIEAIAVLE